MISHVYWYRIEPFVQREMTQITNLGGGTDALLDPLRAVFVRLVDHGEGRDVCRSCQNHEWRGLSKLRGLTGVKVISEQVVVRLPDRV
jgi:hypothetical protein